jgi:hypothetical protein
MRAIVGFIVCGLIYLAAPARANLPPQLQPVALWPAPNGGLYVLDYKLGLSYIPGGADLEINRISNFATFASSWQAVDMTAVRAGNEDRVYVALSQETSGMLMCYVNRQFSRSWVTKTLLNGLAQDAQGQRLFLSGGLVSQIFEFDWNDVRAEPTTKVLVTIRGSQALGPLVYDGTAHVLYAADQRSGEVFAVNVESKTVSRTGQIAGQPSALAFDSTRRMLYVTDAVGRRVWSLNVDSRPARWRLFSNAPDFRSPSAIAVDGNGTVWVGDPGSRAIYRITANGRTTAYRP